ncbi:FecR family protein [Nitrosomonas aestuarii]|uniref:FecR family protein n=1 Tax=Nitrosomonas aestuarii TaxID=52441 RepID=A0A1I3XTT6_9PROT|nr:FecR family protein [Nitrosomonas aestuarii]SFK22930.1 FecR family protein [Nitrosomonas aestuarii]
MEKPQQTEQTRFEVEENSLTEQAAAWFLRIQQSDHNNAEQKTFEAWLAQSEAHRAEYQQYVRLWQNLDQLERKPQKKRHSTIVGIILIMVMFSALHWLVHYEEVIITAIGEREQINLADGTTIDINTNTKLRLALFGLTRKVTIEHGEALFKIGNERLRTFEVYAGNGTIRDIGTEFNVNLEKDKTTVAVLEGAVEISLDDLLFPSAIIQSGQQLSYSKHGLSDTLRADTGTVAAWRKNRLVFRDTPLSEVVQQINRYHIRPVRLVDTQLNTLRVSGEFNATDRDGLVRALKTLFPLQSSELDDMTVLHVEKQ